jgi:hypothetical protein
MRYLDKVVPRAFWTERQTPHLLEKLAIHGNLVSLVAAESCAAPVFKIQDIIIISSFSKFKNAKIFDHSVVDTGREWNYLDRDFWPIRHANELFNLSLTQAFITDEPTSRRITDSSTTENKGGGVGRLS